MGNFVIMPNVSLPFTICVAFVLPHEYCLAISESGNMSFSDLFISSVKVKGMFCLATNIDIFTSAYTTGSGLPFPSRLAMLFWPCRCFADFLCFSASSWCFTSVRPPCAILKSTLQYLQKAFPFPLKLSVTNINSFHEGWNLHKYFFSRAHFISERRQHRRGNGRLSVAKDHGNQNKCVAVLSPSGNSNMILSFI